MRTKPDATLNTFTEAAPAAPTAAGVPAPRPEPSVADVARLLAELFPALFGAGVIKPIKLRIQADIQERAPGRFTKKPLSIFLQRHTTATAYLRALVAEGATRVDLDGQPAGDIAAEHREAASVELARRRAIVEARKHAGREAARASRHDTRPTRTEVPQETSQAASERTARRGAPSAPPSTSGRLDRAPRPAQPSKAPQRTRAPQPGGQRDLSRSSEMGTGAPPRPPHTPRPNQKPARAHEHAPVNRPAVSLTPEQTAELEARRRRSLMLRNFEQSSLSKANFGALNGLSEAALDALLTLAQQERGSR